jgi:hypothetical protein
MRKRARSWIAIGAAYLFVLQAMLSGIALSQMAAAAASDLPVVLCASGHASDDNTGDGSQPGKAMSCAACALCAVSGQLAAPAAVESAVLPRVAVTVARLSLAQLAPVAAKPAGPRLSQGPPRIV